MKTSLKVIGSIFALGAVMVLALHLILLYGLTKAMREVVLPRVKEETGIDAKVERLSLNMASGMLFLKDVEVRNPEGFLLDKLASVDRIEVMVDISSLFAKEPLRVRRVEVENAMVNVIRNKEGEINLDRLRAGLSAKPAASSGTQQPSDSGQPPPELLIETLQANATVHYLDFRLNQLDIALALDVSGEGLSSQRDPETPWGQLSVEGSLGDDRTSFITDLDLRLAPITDPQAPSFDLAGKIMEIDPRIMAEVYSRMGIRSAPFGVEPSFHCRDGQFEQSALTLNLRDIVLEDKLSDRLGGMGSIGLLRFAVPVGGTLQEPNVDVQAALVAAIGGNSRSLLDAFLKGAAADEAGLDHPPETLSEAAVEVLGDKVDEIGESETAKKVLKDLADGKPSDTNAPSPVSSDVLVDILGEQVKEIGEDEALKEDLKNLGRKLFGR